MFSIAFVNIACVICQWSSINTEPALLVVSYDAFHPDYLNRNVTPNLNKFRKEGASAQYLFNVFATETFVNHFSIATVSVLLIKIHSFFQLEIHVRVQGFYAETHGVLSNALYDLKLGKYLKYSFELFHYNNEIIPIWVSSCLFRKY